jgi:hypothetical protein
VGGKHLLLVFIHVKTIKELVDTMLIIIVVVIILVDFSFFFILPIELIKNFFEKSFIIILSQSLRLRVLKQTLNLIFIKKQYIQNTSRA